MVTLVAPQPRLTQSEARARAGRLRLLITDCDGVLTDGSVYYGARGDRMRRFSVRDGMGVERLREVGVETAILSGERCGSIEGRAEKLSLRHVLLGVRDKAAVLPDLLAAAQVAAEEVAYIGDDMNDAGVFRVLAPAGLTAAPADAFPPAAELAHYRCRAGGGAGAFREFAEWILELRREVSTEWRDRWPNRS